MRRAISILLLVVTAVTLVTRPAHAAAVIFNGVGLVDYTRKPDFKVGDWVRYHMKSQSELGVRDEYEVTLVIAGEEDFWGDPAFWLESWIDFPGRPPETTASLISYDIFNDTLAIQRMQLYTRKLMGEDVASKYAELKLASAERCPKALGTRVKRSEIQFHHEVTNQYLWSSF